MDRCYYEGGWWTDERMSGVTPGVVIKLKKIRKQYQEFTVRLIFFLSRVTGLNRSEFAVCHSGPKEIIIVTLSFTYWILISYVKIQNMALLIPFSLIDKLNPFILTQLFVYSNKGNWHHNIWCWSKDFQEILVQERHEK